MSAFRRAFPVAGALVLLAVAVRLPFVGVGLVPDEGGYAYVATAWGDGARLYDEAWVDRPQGLVLAYRALLALDEGALAIRLGAIGAGVAITILLLAIGWLSHSRAAGVWAAGVYAVAGVAPALEGYTLHAELAAAVPATAAIAAAVWWRRRGGASLLVLAGVLGAMGILMKQSGFDGLVVAFAVALSGGATVREAVRGGALVLAGAAVALGVAALHGALLGWDAYWNAIVGYRLGTETPFDDRLGNAVRSLDLAARDLLPLAAIASLGAMRSVRKGGGGRLALVWLAAALVGFNVGGAYWAHYYVQLIPALALLAGVAIAGLTRPALRVALAGAAAAPLAVLFVQVATAPPEKRVTVIPSGRPAERDEAVARYLRRQTDPDERIYVLVSRANVYFMARRRPATRYLWHPPLERIPGAMRRLRRSLAARERPALIALYQPVRQVDRSGRLRRVLAANYVVDRRAPPGLSPILKRRR